MEKMVEKWDLSKPVPEGYEVRSRRTRPVRDGVHNALETVKAKAQSILTGCEIPPIRGWSMEVYLRKTRKRRKFLRLH